MYRAGGELNISLDQFACLECGFCCAGTVADVVETVENQKDINTVTRCGGDKPLHHIIRIRRVAKQILPSQQHTQRRFFAILLKYAKALPRVLFQEAHTGIECCAAPHLNAGKAKIIHLRKNGDHVLRAHPCSDYRLLAIAKIA